MVPRTAHSRSYRLEALSQQIMTLYKIKHTSCQSSPLPIIWPGKALLSDRRCVSFQRLRTAGIRSADGGSAVRPGPVPAGMGYPQLSSREGPVPAERPQAERQSTGTPFSGPERSYRLCHRASSPGSRSRGRYLLPAPREHGVIRIKAPVTGAHPAPAQAGAPVIHLPDGIFQLDPGRAP